MNFKKKVSGSWTHVPHYISGTDTETITTLPATIYPLAQSVTIGLKGNTVQHGTPTPDNPIMPQGTGDMVENLFDKTSTHTSSTNTELYTITGLTPNQSYTCSTNFVADPTKAEASIYFGGGSSTTNGVSSNSPKTMTANSKGEISLYLRSIQTLSSNVAVFNDVIAGTIWVMVNAGTTPIPYGYKIPISSNSQTETVYLGSAQSVRNIKKIVLDGTESSITYTTGNAPFRIAIEPMKYIDTNSLYWICTHYQSVVNNASWASYTQLISWSGLDREGDDIVALRVRDTSISSLDDFKTFLQQQYAAGTPVCVWYVLATEETGIVNEPLMKIGNYADSISGISIPTIAGANTLDVQTTVKPSEVSAAFNGWHPVTSAHERNNGAWT